MSSAVFLQHVPHSPPGRIGQIFRDFGIPCDIRHLYKGDEVPSDLDEIRILVSLGGSQRVEQLGDSSVAFLDAEVALMKRMIDLDRPVLGVALGAQLLAHAAGARVYPNVKMEGGKPVEPAQALPEFGWGPVTFPFPGGTEPIVYGLSDGTPMLHWHFDTFDLPKLPAPPAPAAPPTPPPPTGSVLLSASRLCRNQAFRFKNRLFGFQYHFELREQEIEALVNADKQTLVRVLGSDGADRVRRETKQHYARYSRAGDRIVTNFVQSLRAYSV